MPRSFRSLGLSLILAVGSLQLVGLDSLRANSAVDPGSRFWSFWSDGKAELDGYELTQPRYGQSRLGRAVLIYVTEPFSRSKHVKVDEHNPQDPDQFIALKLNLVRKFQTGIYDYSLMSSLFVDVKGGFAPVKLSFSSQEWCGNLYEELIFGDDGVHDRLMSYFEGESRDVLLEAPASAMAEDFLFISLRQLANEQLQGMDSKPTLLPSATYRRLRHQPPQPFESSVKWSEKSRQLTVPAGAFDVLDASYVRADGKSCTFSLETAYPHRIIAWSCEDGEAAKMTGSQRIAYWGTHAEGDEKLLSGLGLRPMQMAP